MNALKMLEDQHTEIESRLAKLETEALPSVQRQRLLQLATALHVHSTVEQKVFYPAAKARTTEEVIFVLIESHRVLNAVVADLLALNATTDRYRDKLGELRVEFEQHVKEERGELFNHVRKLLDKARLEQIGKEMAEMMEHLTRDPVVA